MKKLVFLGDSRVKKKGKGEVQLFPSDRGHRLAKSKKNETQNQKKEETPENRFCLTLVSFGFLSVFSSGEIDWKQIKELPTAAAKLTTRAKNRKWFVRQESSVGQK